MAFDHAEGDLTGALPNNVTWYKKACVIRLNFSITYLVAFSSANGYNGPMMNGLQSLPQWEGFMNHVESGITAFSLA
jgi:hypothetical protein